MAHDTILSSYQFPSTKVELDKMKDVPYASAVGSIITKDMFPVYGGMKESLSVKCYIDASFTTERDDCKSQSRYVFIINGDAMSWKSSKKSVVAQSTTESKYIAASEVAQEATWMKKFVGDLGVFPSI
ncbi:secreted RxLR effector protein 161-like [Lactuca sativa]|uniref:secreted RxLR effector protein 161-like n=1 Tax=Lactuca sativa TaxID=4236 RepID=UPI001C68C951|nr:secreted RxLR effector protein 161-like [Lactuca sativa]